MFGDMGKTPLWLQRLVAWGGVLLIVLVLYLFFQSLYLSPLKEWAADIERQQLRTRRVSDILASEDAIRAAYERSRRQGMSRMFLDAQKPETAATELQNRIKALIESQTRAKVISIKPLPASHREGYSRISLEFRVKGMSHAGLLRSLHAIESSMPLLIIRSITVNRAVLRYKSVVSSKQAGSRLAVGFRVDAYFRGSPGENGHQEGEA